MVKSMTAYAERTVESGGICVSVEIRTYNSRFLDVSMRLPGMFRHFEQQVKQLITDRLERGRVEMFLTVSREAGQNGPMFEVDTERAIAYHSALEKLKGALGLPEPVPLSLVAGFEGVITQPEPQKPGEQELSIIREAVISALEEIEAMRKREGAFLAEDLSARLDMIEKSLEAVAGLSADLVKTNVDRLRERLKTLLEDLTEPDEGRMLQEAAIQADRCDISEEIVRAKSHIGQFRAALAGKDACGRKLNFLLQELNREINTIGSKSSISDVSSMVVEMKTELEKMREQVQNIE